LGEFLTGRQLILPILLELIIDPACTVVFEAEREESGVMSRPPRRLSTVVRNYGDVFSCSF
jgi:Ca2+-transporting ATPase